MQFGQVIKPVEGMRPQPGIIVDADVSGFALEAVRQLGPRVVLLTTRKPEELDASWHGRARVYQEGEDREAAILKAMRLMDVTRAVVVGEFPTMEGRPLSYKHWSEAFGLPEALEA